MSSSTATRPGRRPRSGAVPPPELFRGRRVREVARDQVALMAFSALTSVALSGVLLLVTSAGR